MSTRIEILRDTVGDWEVFCWGIDLRCAYMSKTYMTRAVALRQTYDHILLDHNDPVILTIENELQN